MNILINADNNYIEKAKDTLLSVKFHNEEKMNVYLIYDEVEEVKLDNFSQFIKNELGGELHLINCNMEDVKLPMYSDYISKVTYFRLFFPFFIEEDIKRILYIDCDIICTNSIKDFYEMDFEDNVFIACENMLIDESVWFNSESNKRLDLPLENKYINAGVLLINVEKYKKEVNREELIKFIDDNSDKLLLQDQDVINKFFYGKIKLADNKYNYQINAVNYGNESNDYVLVHYSESKKPWNYDYEFVNKLKPYYDFLKQKGDYETLEKMIKVHTDNYRDYLLRSYCSWYIW